VTYHRTVSSVCAALSLAAGIVLTAQQIPYEPAKQFGTGITGAFEGWFANPDGSHTFLVGYLNRNRAQEIDVPVGPNNRIEPGGPDLGQPTHFLPGRQTGMFTVTVPKEFTAQQRLTWSITVNGQTNSIPLRLHPDYNVSPFKDSAVGNTPPVLRLFDEKAAGIQGPVAHTATALTRSTSVATPLALPLWTNDDAKYTSLTNAPMTKPRPVVTLQWSKFRGPGAVTFEAARPRVDTIAGGLQNQAFSGRAATTATFSEPGEYVLHLLANDYSGAGGGGEVCCWTTALVKVTVTP
jgi:hypothetical protein